MTTERYTYGQDIAATRWDRLDIACVRDAALRRRCPATPDSTPLVVDLGCGHGMMALTLHDIGCQVIACDPMLPQALKEALGANAIQSDAAAVGWESMAAPDILYSQRMLHYLPYHEAVRIVATLTRKPGAAAYISLAGSNSELRYNYPHNGRPVTERFAQLYIPSQVATHISAPLCLYTPDDAAQLVDEAGLAIADVWESPFGNVKLIAKRVKETTEQ